MPDRYNNFAELKVGEPASAFSITARDSGSQLLVVAPHGGGIEPGSSEIALAIAGADLSYYLFEGRKSNDNTTLHITSSNFDEPCGIALMRRARVVLAVHGEASQNEAVFLGGLHAKLKLALRTSLKLSGYAVRDHANPLLQGLHKKNICNIGLLGAGIQLELSAGLRRTFFRSLTGAGRKHPTARLSEFCNIVATAIRENAP